MCVCVCVCVVVFFHDGSCIGQVPVRPGLRVCSIQREFGFLDRSVPQQKASNVACCCMLWEECARRLANQRLDTRTSG